MSLKSYCFLFSFFLFFFFVLVTTYCSVVTSVFPSCLFVFSFRSVYQHRLACRNFKIIIHSCLEMLGMYGVTWFPLKSYIRTKSKWVKKKIPKKRIDTNQTERIKSKKNVSVHPDIELEKTSHRLGLGYKACLHFFPPSHFTFDVF